VDSLRKPPASSWTCSTTPRRHALRTGKVALVVAPRADGSVEYRFDEARPESRTARMVVDRAVQRAGGQQDPVPSPDTKVSERGSRYIDFVVPGTLGMNLMGSGIWGIGFAIVDARKKKLLKRLIATPMSRAEYLASFLFFRLSLLVIEVRDAHRLRDARVRRAASRIADSARDHLRACRR
jgi:hypothetical protein